MKDKSEVCPFLDQTRVWCLSEANPSYIPQLIYCLTSYSKCIYFKEAERNVN